MAWLGPERRHPVADEREKGSFVEKKEWSLGGVLLNRRGVGLGTLLFAVFWVGGLACWVGVAGAHEIKTIELWPAGAPGARGGPDDFRPTLTIYPAPKENRTGTGVVICPGGGYGFTAMEHEGHQIAAWFNSIGVAGFILDYRHQKRGYRHPAPLQDAQRAIRYVRAHAAEYFLEPNRIGIMGFSAGGHLASTVATHFDAGNPQGTDPVERVSCRPDFAILCYAVIVLGEPITHRGSQENLLGKDPPEELVRSLSNEKQVTKDTPPTFLWHTDEDKAVPPENSVLFYLACRRVGVPAELHIFRTGRHGLGLAKDIPGTNQWPLLCEAWLRNQGFLPKKQ
ncbi:MAG: alpha/beta hydrolase [Thermoguttaceae bacterium]|nr:alpha/beta hydrolase [Thermoguttaceae bacterium]MDW8039386.1 alpha/beta hydrolase [Thermoguttaceae bacterium]